MVSCLVYVLQPTYVCTISGNHTRGRPLQTAKLIVVDSSIVLVHFVVVDGCNVVITIFYVVFLSLYFRLQR